MKTTQEVQQAVGQTIPLIEARLRQMFGDSQRGAEKPLRAGNCCYLAESLRAVLTEVESVDAKVVRNMYVTSILEPRTLNERARPHHYMISYESEDGQRYVNNISQYLRFFGITSKQAHPLGFKGFEGLEQIDYTAGDVVPLADAYVDTIRKFWDLHAGTSNFQDYLDAVYNASDDIVDPRLLSDERIRSYFINKLDPNGYEDFDSERLETDNIIEFGRSVVALYRTDVAA